MISFPRPCVIVKSCTASAFLATTVIISLWSESVTRRVFSSLPAKLHTEIKRCSGNGVINKNIHNGKPQQPLNLSFQLML